MSSTVRTRLLKWGNAPSPDKSTDGKDAGVKTESTTRITKSSTSSSAAAKMDDLQGSSAGGDRNRSSGLQWSSKSLQSNGTARSNGEEDRAKMWSRSSRSDHQHGGGDSHADRGKMTGSRQTTIENTRSYESGRDADGLTSTPVRPGRASKQAGSFTTTRTAEEDRRFINGKDMTEESADSGVGWESPVHATDDRTDEWVKGTHTTVPMDASIRRLITNYSNRSHMYPSPGSSMLPTTMQQAELEAQEYLQDRKVEKKQLGHLNNRFESYIEHVKNLESENISLLAELRTYQEKYTSMSLHLKMKYETEINECRQLGSNRQDEINAMTARQKELLAQLEEWRKNYNDMLSESKDYSKEIRMLELQIKEKEGQITALEAMIRSLQRDCQELVEMLDKLTREKRQLEGPNDDRARTWDIKEKIKIIQQRKADKERQHSEEIEKLKLRLKEKQERMRTNMSREDYLTILHTINRENPGLIPYHGSALNTIITEVVETHTTDYTQLKHEADLRSRELEELKRKNDWLRKRIAELEAMLRGHREKLRAQIDERSLLVREQTHNYTTSTIEYQELQDHNRQAEIELARLRRLKEQIEEEERRLKLQREEEERRMREAEQEWRRREQIEIEERRRIEIERTETIERRNRQLELDEQQRRQRELEEQRHRQREMEERERRIREQREQEERRRVEMEEHRRVEIEERRRKEIEQRQMRVRMEERRVTEQTTENVNIVRQTQSHAVRRTAPTLSSVQQHQQVLITTETLHAPPPKPTPRRPKRKESALTVSWDEIKPTSTSKTEVFRTNQGPVSIPEVEAHGHFVLLENASFKLKKDVFVGRWTVERWITPSRKLLFTFPDNFTLKHEKECKIWARGAPGAIHSPPSNIIWQDVTSWGVGINIPTRLLDDKGEEKATHMERRK
ncbi:PREDICTED: trichohyalin-like [Priapulus caudatus]|uniref:Trichohyalin-like n=1 Tax=Priapulus caudatus TaxID=37621 RepID=A0ABM1E1V7_PRICU|nr:PREDICTED: trichohyalin-like [Priapulus caudatus]